MTRATKAKRISHIQLVTPRLFWRRREGVFSLSGKPVCPGLGEMLMWARPLPVRHCMVLVSTSTAGWWVGEPERSGRGSERQPTNAGQTEKQVRIRLGVKRRTPSRASQMSVPPMHHLVLTLIPLPSLDDIPSRLHLPNF